MLSSHVKRLPLLWLHKKSRLIIITSYPKTVREAPICSSANDILILLKLKIHAACQENVKKIAFRPQKFNCLSAALCFVCCVIDYQDHFHKHVVIRFFASPITFPYLFDFTACRKNAQQNKII